MKQPEQSETFWKVQKWNSKIHAWKDARKAKFFRFDEAEDYKNQFSEKKNVRIIQYNGKGFDVIG